MRNRFFTLLILLTAALPVFGEGFGGAARALPGSAVAADFLRVEEAYPLSLLVEESGQLRLYWQIADGYYLYQHRFEVTLQDRDGVIPLELNLPEGEEKTDEFFGEVVVYYQQAEILATPSRSADRARLQVTSQGCADAGLCYPPHTQTFDVDFTAGTISAVTPPGRTSGALTGDSPNPSARTGSGHSILYMLLLAFTGGAILNLMPCVFPILSLKVLSFARSTDQDRHLHSWVYAAGVVASFVLVAAVLIALQQAGQAIGWGFQLQSPMFVIALAYLFIAMGLSLSGLIAFGGNLMNMGSDMANRRGLSGSFFTGVLAVVVASPCTAPFMGTALGFAVSQPPLIALLVFAALGAGMAAPLLLFSYSPATRALMPRPGPWMETLKQFLAFPLYATAIWLLWIAGRQTGVNTMAAALSGGLLLALGLWLWNERAWRRAVALGCVLAALSLGAFRGLDVDPGQTPGPTAGGTVAWSERAVQSLRSEGKPVFVDVTADWCITCKVNEATVLHTDELRTAFADHGIVYMVADWTNQDTAIAGLVARHGRSGIPLYLMFPADPALPPLILPQILTKRSVLNAIEEVSKKKATVASIFEANKGN